jgi:iron complex outermembrane receptor protein
MLAFGGTAIALASFPALAQQTLEKVEITGSNIRRVQSETAAPVQTVTRDEIEKSGKASVAELLQTLSVDNQGSVPTTFGNGFASGASGISLRGLGAASTLVLINGRRVAPYGLADDGQKVFADLNLIPLEAVERVEILKDGGSSVYGSDAIAGVVNVILRKDYSGTTVKVTGGQSGYGDGTEARAAVTTGFGSLEKDRYNVLLNLEVGKKGEIWYRDRTDRGAVGRIDLRDFGYDAENAALGGTGAITSGGAAAGSSIVGNVRDPATLLYQSRPGCAALTNHPQGDPGGGCLVDSTQLYSQVQPKQDTVNFFARGALQFTPDLQGYSEFNYYKSKSVSSSTPSGVSGSVGYPGGPVSNAGVALGAGHPDNPFAGAARLRYLAADVGPRVSNLDSDFYRALVGLKGTALDWEFDSAALYSQNSVSNTRTGFLLRNVAFALLNPNGANSLVAGQTNAQVAAAQNAAYAALPPGTLWRIGENAGLNSPAMYAALSPTLSNDAKSKVYQIDFHASREFGQLPGGPLAVGFGAEARYESAFLEPTSGTDTGNVIGLGYSAYGGNRKLYAVFGELIAPLAKSVELSASLRADHYTSVGGTVNPKLGFKWTPMRELALRGTYAEGFRAPSVPESGVGGLAAFTNSTDPVRCAAGVAAACSAGQVAIITSPNSQLKPETSQSYTMGIVFDPTPKTSITADLWQITRKNEINQETAIDAINLGHVVRDAGGAVNAQDPGPLVAILANYINSNKSVVKGLDIDGKHAVDIGGYGRVTFDAKWTHIFSWKRTDSSGTVDFAGTHGNCDVTNCIGTPADRVNLGATWELGAWRVGAAANYRGSLENKAFKDDPAGCLVFDAAGNDAPGGCKISSFTTIDLNARWRPNDKLEFFGTIQNLFDKKPPIDPTTYGAQGYNPLDYIGAVGRYFTVGAKYKF